MAEVRIRLDVGAVCLEYSGSRSFYERLVEPLVEAAYHRAASHPEVSHPAVAEGDVGPVAADEQFAQEEQVVEEVDAAPSGPVFLPTSPAKFNQYAGQVGESASTIEQRIMAFAFYLWNYERQEEFLPVDIEAFFRTVHEEPPEDLPTRIADLSEGKRFLEAGATEGTWRMTSKGVNYVKNRLLGAIH